MNVSKQVFKCCIFLLSLVIFNIGCETENHIEKYDVNIADLQILTNGFYAYRRGNFYYKPKTNDYMIWFKPDSLGNVERVIKIDNFQKKNLDNTLNELKIDTLEHKILMQHFVDLSKKFKFGHIEIDKTNKISFSYEDGLREQYVKTFNDSVQLLYLKNTDFKLLENKWFEYKN